MTRRPGLVLLVLTALLLTTLPPPSSAADQGGMVDAQLERRGIKDKRVLDAFRRVRREAYVPLDARDYAYDDRPIPIGHGQTISQPYIVALMTQMLELKGDERVLEVGTGSGYQAAILAELARDVYSVEIVPELATSARLRLTQEGYRNVHVKHGDGTAGWKEYGPYQAIIVTAAAPKVPYALIEQLAEGGVLVMPVGDPDGRQVLIRGVKRGGKLRSREMTEVQFVPLTGGAARAEGSERAPEQRSSGESTSESAGRERGGEESGNEHAPVARERAPEEEPPAAHARSDDAESSRHDDAGHIAPDAEWHRDERELNDDQDDPDSDEPESDTRPHRDERTRVARVPGAPDSDRLGASAAGARGAARSLAAPR